MSYNIGDKIEIKKEKASLEQTFNDILLVLKAKKIKERDKISWCESALNILEEIYKENELLSVKLGKDELIPILEKLIEDSSIENMSSFFECYKKGNKLRRCSKITSSKEFQNVYEEINNLLDRQN